jgi:hypothetical protein
VTARPIRAGSALACVALAALVGVGCSGSKVTTKTSNELPRYRVKTMALVPFTSIETPQAREGGTPFLATPQSVRRSDISVSVPTNVEPPPVETVPVPGYAAEKITHLFWTRLRKWPGLVVTPPSEVEKVVVSLGSNQATGSAEATAAAVAQKMKTDAALVGQVLVYQERVGSRLGANPPAAVGFEVKVVAADGQVLWIGNYYERQRPMTEDFVGFLQRWGAFVTAEELARYGVDEVMKVFPFGTAGEH